MSEPESIPAAGEEALAARFMQLVLQQTNMALMLLGQIANPHTGEMMRDTGAASFFIDQLEMLEAKTRGNLGPEETKLIKQSLMTLRMAFVEAVNAPPPSPASDREAKPPEAPANPPAAQPAEDDTVAGKRFTKKY